jgi:hypothetical protein
MRNDFIGSKCQNTTALLSLEVQTGTYSKSRRTDIQFRDDVINFFRVPPMQDR